MRTTNKGAIGAGVLIGLIIAVVIAFGLIYWFKPGDLKNPMDNRIPASAPTHKTVTSDMGFSVTVPEGGFVGDEMSGHFTVEGGPNLNTLPDMFEMTILRGNQPEPSTRDTPCRPATEGMVNGKKVSINYYCAPGNILRMIGIYNNQYTFMATSKRADDKHEKNIQVFTDIISSFK
jgi:hypothetical protein